MKWQLILKMNLLTKPQNKSFDNVRMLPHMFQQHFCFDFDTLGKIIHLGLNNVIDIHDPSKKLC